MLKFDAAMARFLEDAYQGSDFTARRRANFDALAPLPGDSVLDLGCGNGLLTIDLARAVGPKGHVYGADPSPEMRALALKACAGRDWVTFLEGTGDNLSLKDASIDRAVSIQVFEYIDDIPASLTELHRVLRPGGRLVIGDMHFDTTIWHSGDPARMRLMLDAWDRHLADRAVPELLPRDLDACGFRLTEMRPVTFCDVHLRPDGLAQAMLRLIETYVTQNDLVPADQVAAWRDEQHALAANGHFFFSLTHFVAVAERL